MWIEIIFTGYRENNLRMDKLVQANFKTIFNKNIKYVQNKINSNNWRDFRFRPIKSRSICDIAGASTCSRTT